MSAHSQTIWTIVGASGGIVALGGVAVRVLLKPLHRVANAYTAFMGEPADPQLGKTAIEGVMPRLDRIDGHLVRQDARIESLDRGNLHIIEEQKRVSDALMARINGGATA